ncbi:hypothetical protein [Streptomyces sp. NPDC092370]|uniref:hypothetical protein n=1 Tax=Streptomyces sp. NPDC092370 TaxID=3366016 RepID=UPI003830CD25
MAHVRAIRDLLALGLTPSRTGATSPPVQLVVDDPQRRCARADAVSLAFGVVETPACGNRSAIAIG